MPNYVPDYEGDVTDTVKGLIKTKPQFSDLSEHDVTVTVIFAKGKRNDDGELNGPTLVSNGKTCAAVIKINSLENRAAGMADAMIIVDGDAPQAGGCSCA